MNHRQFKDQLYPQFARIGQALASPKRIEMLDLLAQGAKTVETLAAASATPLKNTSAHLRVLRQACLVETERSGTHIAYRLADAAVFDVLASLQRLARTRLAEVEQLVTAGMAGRDELAPVTLPQLRQLLRNGDVTLVDVRPRDEYEAAHIPGALSIPVPELRRRLNELPKRKDVIAYCRGAYCLFSVEAVGILRQKGYRARRTDDGLPDWRAHGYPVITPATSRV